jgi:copper chaperone CopZ
MHTQTFYIAEDIERFRKVLISVEGIKSVEIDPDTGKAVVFYELPVTPEILEDIIDVVGYRVSGWPN